MILHHLNWSLPQTGPERANAKYNSPVRAESWSNVMDVGPGSSQHEGFSLGHGEEEVDTQVLAAYLMGAGCVWRGSINGTYGPQGTRA